ncbi:SCO family protein [Photobacterium frigidiphilum]|uniref:SCO family protein n=1 Tax=Photobacterium frigidiphilum TaxID=264736 RepID=UPI003D1158D4
MKVLLILMVVGVGLIGGFEYIAKTQTNRFNNTVAEEVTSTFPSVRMKGYLPNIELINQFNEPVRFYDDLVKDKVVLINFIYTNCGGICVPTTSRLARVQEELGDKLGKDIYFYSITLDPEFDTPERLRRYADVFSAQPGWLFLTGEYDDIERLRRKLGVYDLDPIVDADKTQHAGILVYGNEPQGTWVAIPSLISPKDILKAISKVM